MKKALVVWLTVLGPPLLVAYWSLTPPALELLALKNPVGFRMLILKVGSTRFDPGQRTLTETVTGETAFDSKAICAALLRSDRGTASGEPGAAVKIVEFSDYRCPYCKVLAEMLRELQASHDIQVIHKEWPILGQSSVLGARAALAAAGQGRYLDFHEKLMKARFLPTMGYIEDLGRRLELDVHALTADMNSEWVKKTLNENRALAATFALAGTPALIVGRTVVQGAIGRDDLERLIELESSEAQPC